MTTVRKVEDDIRRKLTEIDDIILDWMADMEMPEGTPIGSDINYARGEYMDAITKYMNGLLKAMAEGRYCMECGALIPEDDTVWNHDHECYCKRCATRKMIPF